MNAESLADQFTASEWITAAVAVIAVVISGLAAYYARRSAAAADRSANAAEQSAAATVRQADIAERNAQYSDKALDKTLLRARAKFYDAALAVLAKFKRVRGIIAERIADQRFAGRTITLEELRDLKILAVEAELDFDFDASAAQSAMQPSVQDGQPLFASSDRTSDLLALDGIIATLERAIRSSGTR